ncbi:hypothetical protein [Flavobacteriaceae bacterium 14752]|uniref:hypothetical protein n=1 Tax=Mesohalobacter salilacus TaxID=2491711 RepID=UPI000F642B4F|nr:hypothetical protein EIG84_05815 [Flavobacteriaceae bacterium 14752]
MPKINKIFLIDITPEQFVAACDHDELQELKLELDKKLNRTQTVAEAMSIVKKQFKTLEQ